MDKTRKRLFKAIRYLDDLECYINEYDELYGLAFYDFDIAEECFVLKNHIIEIMDSWEGEA